MSKLVIAEKPMLARDIARAITGKGVRKRPPSHLGKRLRQPAPATFGTGKTGCHRPKMGNALEP